MSLFYRVRQFVAALRATVSAEELALVNRTLTPAEGLLFASMPAYDQRHCLDVYWTLQRAGYTDELLLRAAMFHDCGKVDEGRPMPLLWYTLATLLKRLPPLYQALAASGRGPLRPLRVYAEHAWRGAHLAAAAGSPPDIIVTIRHYHDVAPQGRAALLKWADEQH
ncbi:MAG: hypothetical protein MUD01_09960 [Chloroflexaceae bacterium]|jgi:hypothetical protein|nr:hypothetical protein [Chloroflexaceae bacterium]